MTYDLVVIGGGPGGYTAAIRGSQLGLKVALVEKEKALGGTCLHRGCIPSKAYLAAAEMVDIARRAEKAGIVFGPPKIDFHKLFTSKETKVQKLGRGIGELVKGNKIDFIPGEGKVESAKQVRVGAQVLETRFIILATGTEPVRPSVFPFNGTTILTTDELFQITELPKRLLVVGGGVSGCEMACAFNLLGSQVILVELQPELLPNEDKTVVKGLRSVFSKRGITVLTGISVKSALPDKQGVVVKLSDDKEISVDVLLVAIGRKAGGEGFVKVNEHMETSTEGIYAIGDLVGTTMLAHGAMEEGICAVENIAGEPKTIDYASIPRVVYTIPEIASVGLREEELKKKNIPYRPGRFSYLANGKALCHEEEEGFAQIFSGVEGENKDKVLGASIFGAHAADLIQEVALVMRNKLSLQALIDTVHAHPSLGEIVHEAAADSQGRAIHKVGRRVSSSGR